MSGQTEDKLNGLVTSRAAIINALVTKGVVIDTNTKLSEYASKINSITTGGSVDYYKCNSIDTVNKIWTGYKAVASGNLYTFEDIVTTGLTYTNTPKIGNIYNATGNIPVKLPTNFPTDAIFYASLNGDMTTSESGHTLTKVDNPTYITDPILNRSVLNCTNGKLNIPVDFFPTGANPWTISSLAYKTVTGTADINGSIFGFLSSYGSSIHIGLGNSDSEEGYLENGTHGPGSYGFSSGNNCKINNWYSIIVTYDGKCIRHFINGYLTAKAKLNTLNTIATSIGAIGSYHNTGPAFKGYLASMRIFSRAITDDEAYALALEYAY